MSEGANSANLFASVRLLCAHVPAVAHSRFAHADA